jgi:flavin reductase (DIM6/NTAB) family NADH-FMN oxidoreductase RutF
MAKPRTPLSQVSYGLYVVGACADDAVNAMTANWLTQVSFEPEMVALAVEKDSYTRKLIEDGGVFSVSILKAGQKEIAQHFIKHQSKKGGKIGDYAFLTRKTGSPILEQCSAFLDCRVSGQTPAGDHRYRRGAAHPSRNGLAVRGLEPRDDAPGQGIGERQADQDQQPEEPGPRDDPRQPARPADLHEEENHEKGLDARDEERRDDVEGAQIDVRDAVGQPEENHQRRGDHDERLGRDDVGAHRLTPMR